MRRLGVVALLAWACSGKPPQPTPGSAGSAAVGDPATACDAMRGKVEQLYRASARGEPARIDELVADNTTMVMNDCVKAPDKGAACIAAASTVVELEASCLAPIDDEGTEGDSFAR